MTDAFKTEENRLDQEQENSHGDLDKMQLVFQKKINLYKRYLKKKDLTELDRLRLENKREWIMSHQLALDLHKRILGLGGNDRTDGAGGNDQMNGCAGNDSVNGNAGNDGISGGIGNDAVSGGDGDDNVQGGEGNDIVSGDGGTNTLTGGLGSDRFVCGPNGDTVTDFQPGQDMLIGPCILA